MWTETSFSKTIFKSLTTLKIVCKPSPEEAGKQDDNSLQLLVHAIALPTSSYVTLHPLNAARQP
jgi:hypothetical protein